MGNKTCCTKQEPEDRIYKKHGQKRSNKPEKQILPSTNDLHDNPSKVIISVLIGTSDKFESSQDSLCEDVIEKEQPSDESINTLETGGISLQSYSLASSDFKTRIKREQK